MPVDLATGDRLARRIRLLLFVTQRAIAGLTAPLLRRLPDGYLRGGRRFLIRAPRYHALVLADVGLGASCCATLVVIRQL